MNSCCLDCANSRISCHDPPVLSTAINTADLFHGDCLVAVNRIAVDQVRSSCVGRAGLARKMTKGQDGAS